MTQVAAMFAQTGIRLMEKTVRYLQISFRPWAPLNLHLRCHKGRPPSSDLDRYLERQPRPDGKPLFHLRNGL